MNFFTFQLCTSSVAFVFFLDNSCLIFKQVKHTNGLIYYNDHDTDSKTQLQIRVSNQKTFM